MTPEPLILIRARRAVGQPPLWSQLDWLLAEVEQMGRVVEAARALLQELRVPIAAQQPKATELAFALHDALDALNRKGVA